MAIRLVTLVTCLFIGMAVCQPPPPPPFPGNADDVVPPRPPNPSPTDANQQFPENTGGNLPIPPFISANGADPSTIEYLLKLLEKDGFGDIRTIERSTSPRKRRSAFLGHAGTDTCGSHPAAGVAFMRCFSTGRGYFAGTTYEQNYWRYGNYGDTLNYYNSLPLSNVAPIGDGYTGTLVSGDGRVYQVDACQRCFGGNSGISVQCQDSPYNNFKRNFIFRVNMGVQRAYDGYHGYGREYASPCVGVACETVAVAPAVARVVDPCVGADCPSAVVADGGCVGSVC